MASLRAVALAMIGGAVAVVAASQIAGCGGDDSGVTPAADSGAETGSSSSSGGSSSGASGSGSGSGSSSSGSSGSSSGTKDGGGSSGSDSGSSGSSSSGAGSGSGAIDGGSSSSSGSGSSSGAHLEAGADADAAPKPDATSPDASDATTGSDAGDAGDASDTGKVLDAADASEGNTIPPGLLAYPSQHAKALCEGIGKCCPQYDAGAFDLAACEAASLTSGWDNTTLPNTISIYDAGHLAFNAMQAKVCVTALQGFTCTGSGQYTAAQYAAITNACLGVLSGTIPIGTGGCTSSWECTSGAWCNLAADGGTEYAPDAGDAAPGTHTGVCTALLANGSPCTIDEMCSYVGSQKPAAYCNLLGSDGGVSGSGTCHAAQADSAACGDPNQGVYFDDQACTSQLCGDDFTCGTPVTIPTPTNFCPGYPYPDGGAD